MGGNRHSLGVSMARFINFRKPIRDPGQCSPGATHRQPQRKASFGRLTRKSFGPLLGTATRLPACGICHSASKATFELCFQAIRTRLGKQLILRGKQTAFLATAMTGDTPSSSTHSLALASTLFSPKRLDALVADDGNHRQCCCWICPPPPKQNVQSETAKSDRR